MLNCILGGCGCGKSTILTKQLRQRLEEGKRVLVLVPEQFSFEEEKKLYACLGAQLFNQLHTYSFATLSKDILLAYGSAARNEGYASEQEKLIYLYQAVQHCASQKELLLLEKRRNAPDFIMSLYDMITKIRKAGVSAEKLYETSLGLSDRLREKTHDISRILLAYDRILRENGRYDSLVNLTEAAALADMQYFFEDTYVFIDEFDSFTGDQYRMLEVILKQAADVTAAIRADNPMERPSGIFRGGNHTFHQLTTIAKDAGLSVQTQFCGEYLRSAHADLKAAASGDLHSTIPYEGHVHIMEAADPVMEVEFICAEICRLLQGNPDLHCSQIAIAVKNPAVYFPILERALKRYALPYDLSAEKSVLHKELIRHFLTVLELLSAGKWQTDTILRYMKSSFSGYNTDHVSMLEHFCFTWSIEKDDWNTPFWQEDDDTLTERARSFGGKTLEILRTGFLQELDSLQRKCKGASVRKICGILYQHLCDKKARYTIQESQTDFVMLWNLLMDVLDTMVTCFGEQTLPMEVLYESFLLLLQNSSFSTPPQTLDSIRIVDAQTARLNSPEIVFVPGVSAGEFPAEVKLSGMFSQQELRLLEDRHISLSRLLPELYSDELLIVRKTMAAPTEHLYLTYPLANAAHEAVTEAGIIIQLRQMFSGASGVFQKDTEIPLHFYVRTLASGYFHYVRNLRNDTPELAALRTLLERDPVTAAKLTKLVTAQELPEPSVSPAIMNQILGTQIIVSPSGVEQFYHCAFQYYCQSVLRLYVPERSTFSARSSGDFAHYCLEQMLRNPEFLKLSPEELREEIQKLSGDFSVRHFPDAVRRNGRFQFNFRKAGQSLTELLEHLQKELSQSKFLPVGFEVSVSANADADGFPPLTLRNGEILCQGGIDRIDLCDTPDGKLLRVIDYKTGTKDFTPEKLADGLDMQMLIYLLALQQNGAYDAQPTGVFYMPSGQPKRNVFQSRSEKSSDRKEILREFYQMKGLLLDNAAAWMEPQIQEAAMPVDILKKRSGLFSVSSEQMQHLMAHVEKKMTDMADALRTGCITPEPNLYQEYSPCTYCNFADICGKADPNTQKRSDSEKLLALGEVFGTSGNEEEEDA